MNFKKDLDIITNQLLDNQRTAPGELFRICDELHQFLLKLADLDKDSDSNRVHTMLDSGEAIGATWAALCIKDLRRTKSFVDGIHAAVRDRLSEKQHRPIHILYAGTGPFATLILPLTARFNASEIQFTLLEVIESTYQQLQHTIEQLQLEDYIKEVVCADACTYKVNQGTPIDILISETMQLTLQKEPQVAIFANLLPQLPQDAIVIPEEVTVEAALINQQTRMRQKLSKTVTGESIHVLGTVFKLNKNLFAGTDKLPKEYPPVHLDILENDLAAFPTLFLLTKIQVYKDYLLKLDECGLTIPLKAKQPRGSGTVSFQYKTGAVPGIVINYSSVEERKER